MQVVTEHPSTPAPSSLTLGLDATHFETTDDHESITQPTHPAQESGPCDFCSQPCGPFTHVWSYW